MPPGVVLQEGREAVVEGADVFGDAAHVAFSLGEDISNKEVLIGPNVYNALGPDDYKYEARETDIAGVMTTYYNLETKRKNIKFSTLKVSTKKFVRNESLDFEMCPSFFSNVLKLKCVSFYPALPCLLSK